MVTTITTTTTPTVEVTLRRIRSLSERAAHSQTGPDEAATCVAIADRLSRRLRAARTPNYGVVIANIAGYRVGSTVVFDCAAVILRVHRSGPLDWALTVLDDDYQAVRSVLVQAGEFRRHAVVRTGELGPVTVTETRGLLPAISAALDELGA
jgi:hypothetical protein